jgi:hypothetical protein
MAAGLGLHGDPEVYPGRRRGTPLGTPALQRPSTRSGFWRSPGFAVDAFV